MLDYQRIIELRLKCLATIQAKTDSAQNSHDWVVDSHELTSWELLELLRFAELGLDGWLKTPAGERKAVARA